MQIKNFEDLEIWKEARYLTREIYTLSKAPQFPKDHGLRNQMNARQFQSCRISPKALSVVEIKNSSNISILEKLRAVSCVPNSTWRLTRNISIKR
jgi:hypothetical protein